MILTVTLNIYIQLTKDDVSHQVKKFGVLLASEVLKEIAVISIEDTHGLGQVVPLHH